MDRMRFCDWVSVGRTARVHVCHGIPDRLYAPEDGLPAIEEVAGVVERETGLHVRVGSWHDSAAGDCLEAEVHVVPEDFEEVLNRLAQASAETYWDRYHAPLGQDDTEYLEAAFAADFNKALTHCGLCWNSVPAGDHYDRYCQIVRAACAVLAASVH